MGLRLRVGLLSVGLLLGCVSGASAQSSVNPCFRATPTASGCTPTSVTTPLPVSASVSATVNGFTGSGNYATLTATGSSSASTALPTGSPTTIKISNTGVVAVSCVLATGAATGTTSKIVIAPYGFAFRTVGTFDHIACIDQSGSSSSVVVIEGGSGLGTDGSGTSSDLIAAVQGAVPAGTNVIGKVGIDQTTNGTTNGVVSAANFYQAVAASQTGATLQSSTGATGDYLSHCIIYPASTSPGVVTVFDNTNTAANSAILFPGGASSTSNLTPIAVPVGAKSVNGAWKVTTGASVSVVCVGKFS